MRFRPALMLALALAAPAAAAERAARLVLLPAEGAGVAVETPARLEELLAAAAAAHGWQAVAGETVDRALHAARLRRLDSLPTPALGPLLEQLDAAGLLYTTVESWRPGLNSSVGLSGRLLLADGTLAWGAVASLTAEQTADPFGLGRAGSIDEVLALVVPRLFADLPPPGGPWPGVLGSAGTRRSGAAATFRSAALDGRAGARVILVPFANASAEPTASRVVGDLLVQRLRDRGGFAAVEGGDFRAALLAEGVAAVRLLDPERLRAVGARLGTGLVLRGAIWRWRDGSELGDGGVPEVELELELVDTAAGKVLWAAHHARRGDDYEGLLRRGAVRSAVTLADRTLAEMVGALARARPVALAPAARP